MAATANTPVKEQIYVKVYTLILLKLGYSISYQKHIWNSRLWVLVRIMWQPQSVSPYFIIE